jgi:hypothetical protein
MNPESHEAITEKVLFEDELKSAGNRVVVKGEGYFSSSHLFQQLLVYVQMFKDDFT